MVIRNYAHSVRIDEILFSLSGPSSMVRARKTPLNYYQPGDTMPALDELVPIETAAVSRENGRYVDALRVILFYNMRAAEYLRLTTADIVSKDKACVRGAKGSGAYIILLPGVSSQFDISSAELSPRPLAACSYGNLYKACVRLGIGSRYISHRNISRTHVARHELARALQDKYRQTDLSDFLRHKSARSLQYYVAGKAE